MFETSPLFTYADRVDPRTVHADTLLVLVGSHGDAGHVQRLLGEHLRESQTNHRLGAFDADQLIDYRDQRPPITFRRDMFADYERPDIALDEVLDDEGKKFLLLTGPEPAFQWERLAAAVGRLVDDHDVQLTAFVQGVPMPTPHTRPTHVTRYASDPSLIPGNEPMFGTIVLPAAFPAMLAQRLSDGGHQVVGIAPLIPQYLSDADYPDGALAAADGLRHAASLDFSTTGLAVAAGVVRAQVNTQIAGSEELTGMVAQLERQYDAYMENRSLPLADRVDVPTADEIGREAEKFLRDLNNGKDGLGH